MSANKIREAIKEISNTNEDVYSIVCNVNSVDIVNNLCDCTPLNGDADILEVRLMSKSGTGFLIIPKKDSSVVVTMLNKNTGYVAMFSEVDEIQLIGKSFGGLVKIDQLITKLNNLENAYNEFVVKYNTHIHVAIDSITAAPVTVTPTVNQQTTVLTPTVKATLENIKVLHGS